MTWDYKAALQSEDAHLTHKRGGYHIWGTVDPSPFGLAVVNSLDHVGDEDAAYNVPGEKDIILSGLEGEQWTSSRENAANSYVIADPYYFVHDETLESVQLPATDQNIRARRLFDEDMQKRIFAWTLLEAVDGEDLMGVIVPDDAEAVTVSTPWGEVLHGGPGDLVLCGLNDDGSANLDDARLVNRAVAARTYDLSPWGLEMVESETPPEPDGVYTKDGFFNNLSLGLMCAGEHSIGDDAFVVDEDGISELREIFAGHDELRDEFRDALYDRKRSPEQAGRIAGVLDHLLMDDFLFNDLPWDAFSAFDVTFDDERNTEDIFIGIAVDPNYGQARSDCPDVEKIDCNLLVCLPAAEVCADVDDIDVVAAHRDAILDDFYKAEDDCWHEYERDFWTASSSLSDEDPKVISTHMLP